MSGTIRTLKNETRAMVKSRMETIVSGIAATFNAEAHVEWGAGCPVRHYDAKVYADVKEALSTLEGVVSADLDDYGTPMVVMGSEDFSYVANTVPSVFLGVGANEATDGICYPQHHPMVKFNEDVLPTAAAAYAHVAIEWLKKNK
jgi:hippurate hydrolase